MKFDHCILHDLDNPIKGGKHYTTWNALLWDVSNLKITGYGIDPNGAVVNFKNGKRKNGTHWVAISAVKPK